MAHTLRRVRYSVAALTLTAVVACVDSPTVPTPSDLLTRDVTPQQGAGAQVCKVGAGPTTNFTFAVSIDGGAATNHVIANGSCAVVANTSVTPQFMRVSVTELGPPANWALTNIVITSGASPSQYLPVINSPNAAATISHDFGVTFTFTNTFTPPPPSFCTRTQGYWKNHPEDWDAAGDNKPFLTTTTFFNSGVSYLTILLTPPSGGNAYLQLAHQYIAAVLNTGGGPSGVAAVDAAIAGAAAYFAGAPAGIPNPTGALRTQLQGWATTLDNFNNGVTGPGHCPEGSGGEPTE